MNILSIIPPLPREEEQMELRGLRSWFRTDSANLANGLNCAQCFEQHHDQQVYIPFPIRVSLFLFLRYLWERAQRDADCLPALNRVIMAEDLRANNCGGGGGGATTGENDFLSAYRLDNDACANDQFLRMRQNILEVSERRLRTWLEQFQNPQSVLFASRTWLTLEDCEFMASLTQAFDGDGGSGGYDNQVFANHSALLHSASFLFPEGPGAGPSNGLFPVSTGSASKRFADAWLRLQLHHPFDLFGSAGQLARSGGGGVLRGDVEFFIKQLFQEAVMHTQYGGRAQATMHVLFLPALIPGQAVRILVSPAEAFAEMRTSLLNIDAAARRVASSSSSSSPWSRPLLPSQLLCCVPAIFAPAETYIHLYRTFPYAMETIQDMQDPHQVLGTMGFLQDQNRHIESQLLHGQIMRTELANIVPQVIAPTHRMWSDNADADADADDDDDDDVFVHL